MKKDIVKNGIQLLVDSSGKQVINLKTGTKYSIYKNSSGYSYIAVFNKGVRKNILVSRLVAELFVDNPDKKEQVNHIDENLDNNDFTNLEWVTLSENAHYGNHIFNVKSTITDRYGKRCYVRYDNGETTYFNSIREMCRVLGVSDGSITTSLKRHGNRYYMPKRNLLIVKL